MIFDVARHKFAEGFFTLLLFAVAALAVAILLYAHMPVHECYTHGAPLGMLIDRFAANNSGIALALVLPIYLYATLRLSRPTARIGLYASGTLATIALSAIMLFGVVLDVGYLRLLCVVLLFAEVLGRLVYCFGPNMRAHLLFTAMLALGVLPLVDISLISVAIVIPLIVIIKRGTLRETILTIVGVTLPTFVYCYVMWLIGGDFVLAAYDIYDAIHMSCRDSLIHYLDLPRLIFLGVVLFLQLASLLYYLTERITLSGSARSVWLLLILLFSTLLATLLFMPAASPAVVVALVMTSSLMIPLFFLRSGIMPSILVYIATAVAAIVTLL